LKKILKNFLKIFIVAATLFYLIQSDRLNFEKLTLFRDSPGTLLIMFSILALVVVPMATFRWWLLLRAIDIHVEARHTFVLTWIGNFFNTALPGAVTGDFVKGYYVIKAQEEKGRTKAFMTLLIDRFVGLFGLIIMAFLALIFNYEIISSQESMHFIAWMIIVLFIGTLIFFMIVIFPFKEEHDPFIFLFKSLPASSFSIKIYTAFKKYQNQKKTLLLTLLLSLGIHTFITLIFFQIGQLMEIEGMELATQFFLMPIGLITIAIPIAPGGIGVGHAAFESLYQIAGLSGGADVFNIYFIVQLVVFLLGGIPYFIYSSEYKIPKGHTQILTKETNKP